ncbi:MAG: YihY/virulence factor BrkB family protein [bacterium]|nr:YihY/virulence factor BrkB family protein [bacterium]
MNAKEFVKELGKAASFDKLPSQAAALAFYFLFALFPILLLVWYLGGIFIGSDAVKVSFETFAMGRFGTEVAPFISNLSSTDVFYSKFNLISSAIAVFVVFFGLFRFFNHLRHCFFQIFEYRIKKRQLIKRTVYGQIFSVVLMAAVIIFITIFMLVMVGSSFIYESIFGSARESLFHTVNFTIGFVLSGVLFAVIYHMSSGTTIYWKSAFVGGITSALFSTIVNGLFTFYLEVAKQSFSIFGAAALLLVFLVWAYYMSFTVLIGAEAAKVYDNLTE